MLMPATHTNKMADTMMANSTGIRMTITTISTMTKVRLLLVSINNMVKTAMEPNRADEATILKRNPRLSLILP